MYLARPVGGLQRAPDPQLLATRQLHDFHSTTSAVENNHVSTPVATPLPIMLRCVTRVATLWWQNLPKSIVCDNARRTTMHNKHCQLAAASNWWPPVVPYKHAYLDSDNLAEHVRERLTTRPTSDVEKARPSIRRGRKPHLLLHHSLCESCVCQVRSCAGQLPV